MAPLSSTRSATRDSWTSALRSKRRRVQRSSLRAAYRWSQLDPCRICPPRCRYTPRPWEKWSVGAVSLGNVKGTSKRHPISAERSEKKRRKKGESWLNIIQIQVRNPTEKRPDLFGEHPSNGNVRQKRVFRKNYGKTWDMHPSYYSKCFITIL